MFEPRVPSPEIVATPAGLPAFLLDCQQRVDAALAEVLPAAGQAPADVHLAMRYTALGPSKRVRAAVALLAAGLRGREARAMGVALAVELAHAASLIVDDLPCMDDAPLRRGRPSCHLAFGESTALLAGFGLLALAFRTLADSYEPPLAARLAALLGETVGSNGLVAGQADDLAADRESITFERLERIHRLKTGVLFGAAATGGALAAGAPAAHVTAVAAYAKNLGLAFQIVDDLLDVEGRPAETGKLPRTDAKKTTFVSFSGTAGARELAADLCATACRALEPFGRSGDRLRELATFVATRHR
jgi:farnesyl diphosphate synthase